MQGEGHETENSLLQNTQKLVMSTSEIRFNNKVIDVKKLKQKEIYYSCLYPTQKPSCLEAWSRVFQHEILINEIKRIKKPLFCKKAFNFHWKTLHHAIYTETRLQKMSKSNGVCKLCENENETICHMLMECEKVQNVWEQIEHLLSQLLQTNVNLSLKDIVFGKLGHQSTTVIFTNFIIYNSKWIIWKHRNNVRYGKEIVKDSKIIYSHVLKYCKKISNDFVHSKQNRNINENVQTLLHTLLDA